MLKGTPTPLNLSVLARLFGASIEIDNRIAATSMPHLRRCGTAGLVEVVGGGKRLRLTAKGVEAVRS